MTAVSEPPPRVSLAHEPDFRLGGLLVQPSACRIVAADAEQRLEPRVMEVLVVLARAGGRTVTRDELIEACWEGRFVSDDAITRIIAKVRNLVRSTDPPPFVLETVPKVGFRLTAPEGAAEQPLPGEAGPSGRPPAPLIWRGRPALLVAAALAVLLAIAGGWAIWRSAGGPEGRPAWQNGRVEVILFEPLQREPELERFAVALGDAVVRNLTSNGIDTVQRPVRRDAGGQGGGAEFRIVGTVDRDADKHVVNAQIIDRRSGAVLWSGRIDRPAAATASFEEVAAARIADTLHCAMGSRTASKAPISATEFGLILNACHLRRFVDPPRYMEITRRLARDAPNLSVAHSMHALAIALNASGASPEQYPLLRREVEIAAARALALDPRNGEAYQALGISRAWRRKWREEEQYYLKAAALSPDLPVVRNWYVGVLREVGRPREAAEVARIAAAADPFSWSNLRALAQLVAADGDYPQAELLTERLALFDPEWARDTRFQVVFWWEPPEQAWPKLRALADSHASKAQLACYEKYLQGLARAQTAGAKGLPDDCAIVQPDWRIRMLARQGDVDGAYREASGFLADARSIGFLFYPEMNTFRADPRFMPLAKRLGLVDYWLATDRWPDFCSEPDLPYDCRTAAKAASIA